jgi:1-acyl-sn-glycerol-3-phosphate acyltransferase
MVGTIFVDRNRRGSSVKRMREISVEIARSRRTIVLSPEGTRTRSGQLLPFKSGGFHIAQKAGAEIVPVVIHGAFALCPPDGLKIRPGTIRAEIKEPIPAPSADADPRALAAELETQYRRWLA